MFDYVQNHYNKKVAFNKRDKYDFLKRPACLRKENLYVALDYQLYRNKKHWDATRGFAHSKTILFYYTISIVFMLYRALQVYFHWV